MATRDIRTRYLLDGEGAYKNAIQQIAQEQKNLGAEIGKVDDRMKANGESQKDLRQKSGLLEDQVKLQKERVAELHREMEKLNKEYPEGGKQVDEHANKIKNAERYLQDYEQQLEDVNKKIGLTGDNMIKAGDKMMDVGGTLTRNVTAPIAALGGVAIKSSIDFESSFAGVKKTIDATDEQYAEMRVGILKMSEELPASANAIAEVAESAGQLGIQRENVLGFSRTIIDLSESTNLGAESGASMFAQFANITNMDQRDFDRLGSSIVELGNNGASTEADIMEMSMRLAGAGSQAGLTQAEIIGLGASMTNVGINAEAGGSAMSKLLIQMQVASENGKKANETLAQTGHTLQDLQLIKSHDSESWKAMAHGMGITKAELDSMLSNATDLENFARIAGMTGDEFQVAFGQDAVGSLSKFLAGLQATEEQGGSAVTALEELGITEVRLRDTILRLTGAGEMMNDQIAMSNVAWGENTALTNEANQRYETTESKLMMVKNQVQNVAISLGDQMAPHLLNATEFVGGLVQKFGDLDQGTQSFILGAAGIAAAIGPATTAIGAMTKYGGHAINFFKDGKDNVDKLTSALGSKGAAVGLGAALAAVTIALIAQTIEMTKIDAATQQMIDTARSATSEFDDQISSMGRNSASTQELTDRLFKLAGQTDLTTEEQGQMLQMVSELNKLVPDLNLEYDAQTGKLNKTSEAVYGLTEAYEKQAELTAYEERRSDLKQQQLEIEDQLIKKQSDLADAIEKGYVTFDEGTQRYERTAKSYVMIMPQLTGMVDGWNELKGAQEDNAVSLETAEAKITSLYEEQAESAAKSADKTMDANQSAGASAGDMADETGEALDQMEMDAAAYHEARSFAEEQFAMKMQAVSSGWGTETVEGQRENFVEMLASFGQYQDAMVSLQDKVSEEYYAHLVAMGDNAVPILQDLNSLTQEQLDEHVRIWEMEQTLVSALAAEGVDDIRDIMINGYEGNNAEVAAILAEFQDEIAAHNDELVASETEYADALETARMSGYEMDSDKFDTVEKVYDELERLQDEHNKKLQDEIKKHHEAMADLVESWGTDTLQGYGDSLIQQYAAWDRFEKAMDEAQLRVNDRYFEHLQNLGYGANAQLEALNSMTDDELAAHMAIWEHNAELMNALGVDSMEELHQIRINGYTGTNERVIELLKVTNDLIALENDRVVAEEQEFQGILAAVRADGWAIEEESITSYQDLLDQMVTLRQGTHAQQVELAKADIKTLEAYQKDVDRLSSDHLSNMSNFGKLEKDIKEATANDIMEMNRKQIEGYKNYNSNVQELSSRVPQHVMDELRKLGPGAAHILEEYNNMTDAELSKHVGVWDEKFSLANQKASEQLGGLPDVTYKSIAEAEAVIARETPGMEQVMQEMTAKYGIAWEGASTEALAILEALGVDVEDVLKDTDAEGAARSNLEHLKAGYKGGKDGVLHEIDEIARASQDKLNRDTDVEGRHNAELHSKGFASKKDEILATYGETAKGAKAALKQDTDKEGIHNADAFERGFRSKKSEVLATYSEVATESRKKLDIRTDAEKEGVHGAENYRKGLLSLRTGIANAGKSLGTTAKDNLKTNAHSDGAWTGQSFINGLESKRAEIKAAAKRTAGEVPSGLRSGLQISSPSRIVLKDIKENVVKGAIIDPMLASARDVQNAAKAMVKPITELDLSMGAMSMAHGSGKIEHVISTAAAKTAVPLIDYDRLGETTAKAIAGMKMTVNNREFGAIVAEHMPVRI